MGKFDSDVKIGWDRRSLREMLEESEVLFEKTGHYLGLENLELKGSDPMRYEKIFAKLRGGLVNARETAMNISASPIVQEIGELCFALYTPEGDSVVISTGIIVHVHTMSDAIKFMIRNDYEKNPRIMPGDMFSNNDPKIGNVHNSDVQTLVPLFWEDEIIGWAGGVTHVLDIGASTPGNVPVGPTTRYEDGLALTALKTGEEDTVYRDHELRCQACVRTPMYWMLDERTRIAGCHMIRDTVERVIMEEGIDTYKQFVREVIEEGRRSFIERIRELTVPGRYFAPTFMAIPWKDEPGLPMQAAVDTLMHAPLVVEVGPSGEFSLDMEGANAWGYHSFNCSPSAMQGAIWVLLSQTVIPNDKVNDGAYLATRSNFPPGTWANPAVPMAATGAAWGFLIPALTGLFRSHSRAFFARGFHEEILAGYGLTMNAMQGGGTDQYGKQTAILNFEVSSVGGGASGVKDGLDYAAAMWNPEGDMGDMEVWELLEPLLFIGRKVKPNTAGPGRYRGGSGYQCMRMVWNTDDLVLQNAGDGPSFSSPGLFGGYPAACGYRHNVVNSNMLDLVRSRKPYPVGEDDPENSEISTLVEGEHQFDKRTLTYPSPFKQGDLYLSWYRGGAGLGDPLEREVEAVEDDLNGGFLLPSYAEKAYGAVCTQDERGRWQVDADKTAKRRKAMKAQRKKRSVPVKKWLEREREVVLGKDFHRPVYEMYASSFSLSPTFARFFREFWGLPEDYNFE